MSDGRTFARPFFFRPCCFRCRTAFRKLRPGDVVYADPPYVPLFATANFTSYSGRAFGLEEQRQLAALAARARDQGVPVLPSNHDTPVSRELHRQANRPIPLRA